MTKQTDASCEQDILRCLAESGATGLNKAQLGVCGPKTTKANALKSLEERREVINLGSSNKTQYVLAQYFQPLEMAYVHIETLSNQNGIQLASKSSLIEALKGKIKQKADEAIKLLVQEGRLIKLSCRGNPVYLNASALPQTQPVFKPTEPPSLTAILKAYRETVAKFRYPDVLIHEVFLRLGGDLEALKLALKHLCQEGKAVASTGDWSLSSTEMRAAALDVNGHPHLRIRITE